jgi:hypothetical protein
MCWAGICKKTTTEKFIKYLLAMEYGAADRLMQEVKLYSNIESKELKWLDAWHRHLELGALVQSGRILHYGCGIGHTIKGLSNAVGYEKNPFLAEKCRERGISAVSQDGELSEHAFDIILCSERALQWDGVFSGITPLLQRVRKLIHKNGTLLLTLENNFLQEQGYMANDCYKLKEVLQQNGFEMVEITPIPHIFTGKALTFSSKISVDIYLKMITLLSKLSGKSRWLVKAVCSY